MNMPEQVRNKLFERLIKYVQKMEESVNSQGLTSEEKLILAESGVTELFKILEEEGIVDYFEAKELKPKVIEFLLLSQPVEVK